MKRLNIQLMFRLEERLSLRLELIQEHTEAIEELSQRLAGLRRMEDKE